MAHRPLHLRVAAALLAMAVLVPGARAQTAPAETGPSGPLTDMNIVVALDRSESVGIEDRMAQVDSLAQALIDPRFLAAVRAGWYGRIGFAVMTWSSFERTQVAVPWALLRDRENVDAVVAALREYQARGDDADHKPQTDLSLALEVGGEMLTSAPFPTIKGILNVVSDGVSNFGREAYLDRDHALAQGITINGLIHAKGSANEVVRRFFEREVIGGPYAFVLSTLDAESFTRAMLRKMLMEIANAQLLNRPDGFGSFWEPPYGDRRQKNPAGSAIGLSSASPNQPLMIR